MVSRHAPAINTAIAHRDLAVARIIGAGIATPPLDPFVAALVAFGLIWLDHLRHRERRLVCRIRREER